jgi:hypothetical protein
VARSAGVVGDESRLTVLLNRQDAKNAKEFRKAAMGDEVTGNKRLVQRSEFKVQWCTMNLEPGTRKKRLSRNRLDFPGKLAQNQLL